jgi:hypothetical protein
MPLHESERRIFNPQSPDWDTGERNNDFRDFSYVLDTLKWTFPKSTGVCTRPSGIYAHLFRGSRDAQQSSEADTFQGESI